MPAFAQGKPAGKTQCALAVYTRRRAVICSIEALAERVKAGCRNQALLAILAFTDSRSFFLPVRPNAPTHAWPCASLHLPGRCGRRCFGGWKSAQALEQDLRHARLSWSTGWQKRARPMSGASQPPHWWPVVHYPSLTFCN